MKQAGQQDTKGAKIMRDSINWTPLGCGAAALGFAKPVLGGAPDFPTDLVSRVEYLDLGVESVFLAWEIARLAGGGLNPDQQRALVLLILAAQLASAEGSTRLPIISRSYLDRTLEEFKTTDHERAAIDCLLESAQAICRESEVSGLSEIFGGPEAYKPLIIDHECLYIQKLHVLEARVGRGLCERITSEAEMPETGAATEKPSISVENALREVFELPPSGPLGKIELDDEQKEAVRTSLSGSITVISGRPGSGKTSIVASLLRVLARVGNPPLESIALASPTGKAADRMRLSIEGHLQAIADPGQADSRLAEACPPSSTLHRLLGYSPGQDRFWHNEHNPLAEQLVIVDESSMIDLAMMDRLLRAMRPEARLILLGDADQLPSIDAGAVLRDLCQAGLTNERGRVVKLKKSYRAREEDSNGKRILAVAAAINKGSSPETSGGDSDGKSGDGNGGGGDDGGLRRVVGVNEVMAVRKQVADLRFAGVEHLLPGDEAQRLAFYVKWRDRLRESLPDLDERLSKVYISGPSGFDAETIDVLRLILSHYERFRILCVTRVTAGGTGSVAVNDWFHRQWFDILRRKGEPVVNSSFLVGEPVLITRNNYNLHLYNGDSGLVLQVATAGETRRRSAEPMAVFPRGSGFVAFPLETLRGKLDLAWATTIHKAQGSEYEDVAIILPEVPLRPLTRELLYTAVTRAKNSVVIVGPEAVLASGITRSIDRASGLADALSRGRGC
jgi:exodeoxyribonuclease V alpha subunit